MEIGTGIAIGFIVLFSLVGLGIFLLLLSSAGEKAGETFNLTRFLESITSRLRK